MSQHIKYSKRTSEPGSKKPGHWPYHVVTTKIIEALEQGVVPWRKPWRGADALPCNVLTSRPYRGINLLLLSLAPYSDNRWLTLKQANSLGGQIRQGESSTVAIFWKVLELEPKDEDGKSKKKTATLLRYYRLFNVEQCIGLDLSPVETTEQISEPERVDKADAVLRNMTDPPSVVEGGSIACYSPAEDRVKMPRMSCFKSVDAYYATLFHEIGHATGHPKRLNRPEVANGSIFGSSDYGREELVAELTSAFCCASIGLDNSLIDNSASYIQSWLTSLRSDTKAIIAASSKAQRAADYIYSKR